jgi:hypothetical protein
MLLTAQRLRVARLMLVFELADKHPLTKAGLRCVKIVEKAELGLRPGDVVFEFPYGRIVDTSMACRRYGIIPPDVDLLTIQRKQLPLGQPATSKVRQ